MTQGATWPTDLTRTVAAQIRRYREEAKMSAQDLADAVTAMGMRYTRTQVTNLESGRRDTITIGEVLAFAAVLQQPPALLLFPIGSETPVPLLPEFSPEPWTAYRYFIGDEVLAYGAGPKVFEVDASASYFSYGADPDVPIRIYRQHHANVSGFYFALPRRQTVPSSDEQGEETPVTAQGMHHLSMVAEARIEMHRRGWALPHLETNFLEYLDWPLRQRGYSQDQEGRLHESHAGAPFDLEYPQKKTTEGAS